MNTPLQPIYPYFGGKRRASAQVWDALGNVNRYIEPFFGAGAVLLGNPNPASSELVNDINHYISNLWRALQHDPDGVWQLASCPISEIDLKARQQWLKAWQPPDFNDVSSYDVQAAGYWLWVACVAITPEGESLQRNGAPRGIKGREFTREWYDAVVDRFRRVEVLCGDWSRCLTPATSGFHFNTNPVGIFLDPPYGVGAVHYEDNTGTVARDVWEWAVANGDNPRFRIVVAGYDDKRELPQGWLEIKRKEHGGYGGKNGNRQRERLWISPHCISDKKDSTILGL